MVFSSMAYLKNKNSNTGYAIKCYLGATSDFSVLFFFWLQDYLNVKFKETGHSNMYFPQVCTA
jgi:hypothetical protein